jgi:hypothetical protein
MVVDPLEGVADSQVATFEDKGFVVALPQANPARGQPDVNVVYFPRRRDVELAPASLARRDRVAIGLVCNGGVDAPVPYYVELDSWSDRDRTHAEPFESLRLYVDRDVAVRFPESTNRLRPRSGWGTVYSIDLPPAPLGIPRNPLLVYVHRSQNRAAIPQSRFDTSALFPAPVVVFGDELSYRQSTLSPEADVVEGSAYRPYCVHQRTEEGGAGIVLGLQRIVRRTSTLGTSATPTADQPAPIGFVDVGYFNPEHIGRYHVDVAREPSGTLTVTLTMSRNCVATFSVPGAGENVWTRAHGADVVERARAAFEGSGIALRVLVADDVPRPGEAQRRQGDPWYASAEVGARLRVVPVPAERLYGLADLADDVVGAVPVVGDLYDLGHLVYALVTGERFSGDPVDDMDLLAMGLAVLPGIPSAVQRLRNLGPRVGAARARIERSLLGFDGVRAAVRAHRPRLAGLDEAVPALARAEPALVHGIVRDERLAGVLGTRRAAR